MGKMPTNLGRLVADSAIFLIVRGRTTRPRRAPQAAVADSKESTMSLVNRSIRRAAFVAALTAVVVFAAEKQGQCGVQRNLTFTNASDEIVLV
jgi:hypothetical protein